MTDIIVASIVWIVNILIFLIVLLTLIRDKKHDNIPIVIGLSLYEVILTIYCGAIIIANISV